MPQRRAKRAFCGQDCNFTRETDRPDADCSSGSRAAAPPPLRHAAATLRANGTGYALA
ncbi:hypothetical protein C7S15_3874 [Burkholderia cepacia]|nr:hypothetical protein [Burkholderia cepacia]